MKRFAIQLGHCSFCFLPGGHGYEAKAFGAVGLAIDDDFYTGDLAGLPKEFFEVVLSDGVRQISDKKAWAGNGRFIRFALIAFLFLRFGKGFGGFLESEKI